MAIFNLNDIVEAIMHMKMPKDGNVAEPIDQEEMNILQSYKILEGVTSPNRSFPDNELDQA
jgi:hypothetical protein